MTDVEFRRKLSNGSLHVAVTYQQLSQQAIELLGKDVRPHGLVKQCMLHCCGLAASRMQPEQFAAALA